eukprot:gene1483-2851_t
MIIAVKKGQANAVLAFLEDPSGKELDDKVHKLKNAQEGDITSTAQIKNGRDIKKIYSTDRKMIAHGNEAKLVTSLTSPSGSGALLEAQNMLVELKTLIADSRSQYSSENLRTEVDNVMVLSNGEELFGKHKDVINSDRDYMSLDSVSKTLMRQVEMKLANGNISTETFYKVKLKPGMKVNVDDINTTIKIDISESIEMKILIKDDKDRIEWVAALRCAVET